MRCPLRIRPGWSRCFDSLELELRAVSEVGKKQIVEGEEGAVSIGSSFLARRFALIRLLVPDQEQPGA